MCDHWLAEAEHREDEAQREPPEPEPRRVPCPVCITSDCVESFITDHFECERCHRYGTLDENEQLVWLWHEDYQLDEDDVRHIMKLIIEARTPGHPRGYTFPPMEGVA